MDRESQWVLLDELMQKGMTEDEAVDEVERRAAGKTVLSLANRTDEARIKENHSLQLWTKHTETGSDDWYMVWSLSHSTLEAAKASAMHVMHVNERTANWIIWS